jgi:hypothetical protein
MFIMRNCIWNFLLKETIHDYTLFLTLPYVSAGRKSLTKDCVRETTAGLPFHGRNLLSKGTMFHNKWHAVAQIFPLFTLFILPTLM